MNQKKVATLEDHRKWATEIRAMDRRALDLRNEIARHYPMKSRQVAAIEAIWKPFSKLKSEMENQMYRDIGRIAADAQPLIYYQDQGPLLPCDYCEKDLGKDIAHGFLALRRSRPARRLPRTRKRLAELLTHAGIVWTPVNPQK